MKKPRVLVAQPSVQPPGGGNGVAAWILHALQDRAEVTLLTLEPFEATALNRFYGTDIDGAKVRALRAAPRIYPRVKQLGMPLTLLKSSLVLRELRAMSGDFDLVISPNNEADLEKPGIQYIHFPTYIRPRPEVDQRAYHKKRLMNLYYGVCDRIAGVSREGVMRNVSLVNSDWTGRLMSRWYDDAPTVTLYPPVAGDFPDVPWAERERAFVCIGRIAVEKNYERMFAILRGVRERFPEIRLHFVGTRGEPTYTERILRLIEAERAWVTLHENIARSELVSLVARQRYGIHTMAEEHFGMGVAEMVRAGNIVWVPNGGGQVEILDREPALLFRRDDEAVDKICRVLADPDEEARLRARLEPQRERFSEAAFVSRFLAIVDDFFAAHGARSG